MQYDEQEFHDFRQHVMSNNGDFSVSFGEDYIAFHYGDGKSFPVGFPPHKEDRGHNDKRMLALVTMSQVFTLMGSKAASSTVY